jgi:nucleotide-binding universal stress UspA family protein
MNRTPNRRVERIVVALDASGHSLAALRAAAQLAAQLQAELHGLFIEDDNLLRLSNLPFGQEVGLVSAVARPLDSRAMERQFRAIAASLQQSMARVAESAHVRWSFQVTRGSMVDKLLAAAADAELLSLGYSRRVPGSLVGAATEAVLRQTPRPVFIMGPEGRLALPFTLIYSATEPAERALELAVRLAHRTDQPLHILLVVNKADVERTRARLYERLADEDVSVSVAQSADESALTRLLQTGTKGTLILPAEYADQLSRLNGSVIVVP